MSSEIEKAFRRAYYRENAETCKNAVKRYKETLRRDPKVQAMAAALRKGRLAMGKTQREIAAALGTNYRVVGYWEQGRLRPNVERIGEHFPDLAEEIRRAGDGEAAIHR